MTRTHYRTCTLCEAMCGIEIQASADKVLSIRGDEDDPFSQGHICPKAAALQDLHEDPDRLRTPMRKTRGGFVPISWDEAIDEAAERIHGLQRRHGKNAIGIYLGNPNVHNLGAMTFGPQLIRALRTKNRFSASSVDQWPHMFAAYFMMGHQFLIPIPDVDRADYAVILGANPLASNGSLMSAPGIRRRLDAIRERGEVVVFDPRRSETAARAADAHHFIRPGTDALLLLSMLHEVFARNAATLGRLEGITRGLKTLEEVTREFTAESTAPLTGVPAEVTKGIVTKLLETPRAFVYGRMGTSTQEFGGLATWLINALNAVTGHMDREGGVMFTQPAFDALKLPGGAGIGKGSHGRWRSRVRGLPEFGGELPVVTMAEEILEEGPGQIRGMITVAGNPILSTPNGQRTEEAFESLELCISIDPFINATTRHADLILPPVSPLERAHYDISFHLLAVRNTAKYADPLFEPADGALDDWQISLRIARKLEALRNGRVTRKGAELLALETAGPVRTLDVGLRSGPHGIGKGPMGVVNGLSVRKLRNHPHGIDLGPLQPCLRERFGPKQQHVELAPSIMVDDLDRLRKRVREQQEAATPELLLIGRRQLRTNNSWLHNSPRLMRGKDRCTVMLHPDDAERLDVAQGAQVTVRSRVGEVTLPAVITSDIMPGVVSIPHGFGHGRKGVQLTVAADKPGASINDLTDHLAVDTLTGNAALNGVPVELSAV